MLSFCLKSNTRANDGPSYKLVLLIVIIGACIQSTLVLAQIKYYADYEGTYERISDTLDESQQDEQYFNNGQPEYQQTMNYHSQLPEEEDDNNQYNTIDNYSDNNSFIGYASREMFGGMPATAPPNKWRALQRYRGFAMLRTQPQTKQQVEQLRKFLDDPVPGIDFWREPTRVNQSVDIMLSPEARDAFRYTLEMMNLSGRILIPDIGK